MGGGEGGHVISPCANKKTFRNSLAEIVKIIGEIAQKGKKMKKLVYISERKALNSKDIT